MTTRQSSRGYNSGVAREVPCSSQQSEDDASKFQAEEGRIFQTSVQVAAFWEAKLLNESCPPWEVAQDDLGLFAQMLG
jgi:hypothetical protein